MSRVLHKKLQQVRILVLMNNFSEWINKKFVEWQAKEGRRKTIEEFAIYLGISRPLLNMWMNGNKKPGKANIDLLAEVFGNDVYDALGLPRPNIYKQKIDRLWDFLPEDIQKRLSEEAEQYETQNVPNSVSKASSQRKKSKV